MLIGHSGPPEPYKVISSRQPDIFYILNSYTFINEVAKRKSFKACFTFSDILATVGKHDCVIKVL